MNRDDIQVRTIPRYNAVCSVGTWVSFPSSHQPPASFQPTGIPAVQFTFLTFDSREPYRNLICTRLVKKTGGAKMSNIGYPGVCQQEPPPPELPRLAEIPALESNPHGIPVLLYVRNLSHFCRLRYVFLNSTTNATLFHRRFKKIAASRAGHDALHFYNILPCSGSKSTQSSFETLADAPKDWAQRAPFHFGGSVSCAARWAFGLTTIVAS